MRLEAHVNAPFGNQGAWDLELIGPNANYRDDAFRGLVFAQHAYNEDAPMTPSTEQPGVIWEWAIPWAIFTATNPNRLVTAKEVAAWPPGSSQFIGNAGEATLQKIELPFLTSSPDSTAAK